MNATFDCIVVGVGGFGSAALFHLSRRGARALGLDRFPVGHDRGSSHGESRIIRKAYFEHPDYVPLLLQAHTLWDGLDQEYAALSHEEYVPLRTECGLMLSGPPDGEAISGARLSARRHGLRLDDVDLFEARQRFPGLRFPGEFAVVFEPEAGYLRVERCVRAHAECAMARGATIASGETVVGWQSDGRTVRVQTDRQTYQAGTLIVAGGAWAGPLLPDLNLALQVVRKVQCWHPLAAGCRQGPAQTAVFYVETPDAAFYGMPTLDGSAVKIGQHSGGDPVCDPLHVERRLLPSDRQTSAHFVRQYVPGLAPEPVRHSVCFYTNSPDRHFIVDRHPQFDNVVLAAGFSGHGFKFTSVLGDVLAELACEGQTSQPVGFLGLDRLRQDQNFEGSAHERVSIPRKQPPSGSSG